MKNWSAIIIGAFIGNVIGFTIIPILDNFLNPSRTIVSTKIEVMQWNSRLKLK